MVRVVTVVVAEADAVDEPVTEAELVAVVAGVLEAVDKVKHYTSPDGQGVLFDPEDLSRSAAATDFDWSLPNTPGPIRYDDALPKGVDGYHVPRLSPPLREHAVFTDSAGGLSGTFFPFIKPSGKHGPEAPGYHHDLQVQWCEADADESTSCDNPDWYDNGATISGMVGRYLASGGAVLPLEECFNAMTCDDELAAPEAR